MIEITSNQNKIIKHIKSLHKKNGRKKAAQYFVEGTKVFEELDEKEVVEYIFFSQSFFSSNEGILIKAEQFTEQIYLVSDVLFKEISDTETPQGLLVVLQIKEYQLEDFLEHPSPFFVVGDNIQDPGNIGTMIRTADASGAQAVILNKGSVDVYNPKAIRSMMGSQFHIPIIYVEDLVKTLVYLQQRNISIYAAHLKGQRYHYEVDYTRGTAIIIGNESNGIAGEVLEEVTELIKIPMIGRAESLNAGIAAGILMYEVVRQRLAK